MRAVDTNVLVRLLVRDNEAQVATAEQFVSDGAWVSVLVLMEAVWVWTKVYNATSSQIATGVERLLEHTSLAVESPEAVGTALADFRRFPKLGFSDCLIVASARHVGHMPLGSFDRDLCRLDGTEKLLS